MTLAARLLQNGPGNYVDHNKYMDNWFWVFAMAKGSAIANGGLESWAAGTSFTNPTNGTALADGWSLEKGGTSAATADVTREGSTIDSGSYSLKVLASVAGSSDSYLKIKQSLADYTRLAGQSMTFGVKVKTSTANKVRLSVTDGVTTVYSDYHTGDGNWQLLTATIACAILGSISQLTVRLEITSDFASDAVYMDSAFFYITDPSMSLTARQALLYFTPDELQSLSTGYMDLKARTSAPAAVSGRIYFNSTDGQFYGCKDGVTWVILG